MKWIPNVLIAYKPKFKYPSAMLLCIFYVPLHLQQHTVSYTNMQTCSGPVPPPFWESVFCWPNSSSSSSLLLWNLPTVKFLPLFSSWRMPLFLYLAVFPMHMQYLLTSSTFLPFFHYFGLVTSWKSLYISL